MGVPRLFVDAPLAAGTPVRLERQQAHYLVNVMRVAAGGPVALFNGRDGEWLARLGGGRAPELLPETLLRPQAEEPGPILLFAPIKRPRLEWLVEKAVELGVARLVPVLTERTVVRPESAERLRAKAIEAAEQCGRLGVPALDEPGTLLAAVDAIGRDTRVAFADEAGDAPSLLELLERDAGVGALLVGPEGGFAPAERRALRGHPAVRPVSLGPTVLRAETAALYASTVWAAVAARRAGGGVRAASSASIPAAGTGGDSR
ncbi:MAG: 16S rRNA (uracil(1498)-N(3))-methyltransferase [Geminicoccaceae bacterium]